MKKSAHNKPKQVSNPASTGGAGVTFEHRVQASRLLAMCLGHSIPGRDDGRIVELRFQSRVHGHHTDDLVCTLEDRAGARSRMLLQMKRTMSPRETDDAFSDAVGNAWVDFSNLPANAESTDSYFLVYDNLSAKSMAAAQTVGIWARRSANASEFLHKVNKDGFSNAANRNALAAIRSIASDYAKRPITDEDAFRFIKRLNFISQDLDREGTAEYIGYLSTILSAAVLAKQSVEPREVWDALVSTCAGLNKDAATVTFDNLSEILGSRLALLFAAARDMHISTLTVIASPPPPSSAFDQTAKELGRLSERIEALFQIQTGGAVADVTPAARGSSLNKLVSRQLDFIKQRINEYAYRDAFEELVALGEDQSEFDAHQKARWTLMRAVCRWHLEGGSAAADDFLAATELCSDDDKLAAARVRGLLLKNDVSGALKAGEEARKRFPDSLTVWQIHANARSLNGETLDIRDIPPGHAEDPEALQVIAWAKHNRGALTEAMEVALAAISKANATFFVRDLALQLILQGVLHKSSFAVHDLIDPKDRRALNAAVQAFSPRAQNLWNVQSPESLRASAHNLSLAYMLLGDYEEALNCIAEARSNSIDSPGLLGTELSALGAMNQMSTALARGRAELSRLPKDGLVKLAQLAAEAGEVEVVESAALAAHRLEPPDPKVEQILVALRWEAMYRFDKPHALAEVKSRTFDDKSSVEELAVAGRILLGQGAAEATALVDMAASRLDTATDSAERLLIAQLMLFAKRWSDAAGAYESILPIGLHSSLHNDLLLCYIRLGQRVRARELLASFSEGWEKDQDTRALAIELGQQAGDWKLLSKLAPAQLEEFPNAASSWLFKLMVAGRSDETAIETIVADIPVQLTGNMRELTQIAAMEIRYGQKERALRRLYEMRRSNMDSVEAASSHLIAHVAITDDLPFMEDSLEEVIPGSSVTLTSGDGSKIVHTIDPAGLAGLPKSQEFVSPESEVARLLVGARVGSEIAIQDNFGGFRHYAVSRIQSAFRRLLELSQIAHQTSVVPSKYATSLSISYDSEGNADFSALEKQLKRTREGTERALEIYRTSPITLGGMSRMLGHNVLDIVRGWRSEAPPLDVGGGSKEEREAAVARIDDPSGVYVVDAATLAELAFADVLRLLEILPLVLVTSATRDLVEYHLAERKLERSVGTAFLHEGRLAFQEITERDRAREVVALQAITDAIRTYCCVVPAYGTKDVSALAKQVEGAVSPEEHAVLLLAAERQATLLSMDRRLRSFALELFKLQGVWPQALAAAAHRQGKLSVTDYSLAVIKWFLANRWFISVSAQDLVTMIYQGTTWLRYGMNMLSMHIASPDTEFASSVSVSLGFLQLVARGHCHCGPFAKLLECISEALHRHKNCPEGFAGTLTRVVQTEFASDNEAQMQLLVRAIHVGAKRARLSKREVTLDEVQVLMCSAPPWIAHTTRDSKPVDQKPAAVSFVKTQGASLNEGATATSPEASNKDF